MNLKSVILSYPRALLVAARQALPFALKPSISGTFSSSDTYWPPTFITDVGGLSEVSLAVKLVSNS